MHRSLHGACLIVSGLLAITASCRRPPAQPKWAEELPVADELTDKPLYEFNEAEVDRYLRILPQRIPDLRERIIHLGRKNLGQPYEIYLLGEFPFDLHDPQPLYCLSKSDCVVFSEHMFAMGLADDWWSFLGNLQRIRYRDGEIGMLTRNHYTIADWDRNNAFLFEDLTKKLGNGKAWVPLNQVCRRARFFARHGIGQDIPDEVIKDAYIPTDNVPDVLDELKNADFVNIIRGSERSQYAGHTGLIALTEDGGVNFLHSARPVVREQPLMEYLRSDRRCRGIKILRLRPDAVRIIAEAVADSPLPHMIHDEALNAAVAATPLAQRNPQAAHWRNWIDAMRTQSYRIDYDTPTDADLQSKLERIDGQIAKSLDISNAPRAFGVLDLSRRRLAMIGPDEIFYGASVPKICILLAYFETHPEAVENLSPQVRRELEQMIKRSDNELAAKYSQLVGLDAIQEMLQSRRYEFYDADHGGGLWCGKHYGIDQPRTGDPVGDHSHAVTVRQALRYYLMLEQGRLVSPEASARMQEIFAAPQLEFHNDRFVLGLNGRDVTMLRKSGWWEDWHLDTARVQHGQWTYLLAGMVHHSKGPRYLTSMAAALDEAVCGQAKEKPFAHKLYLHDEANDFAAGRFVSAKSADDGTGVLLQIERDDASVGQAIYESPPIDSALKFNEVVASCNVDTPPETGFRMEIRVGRQGNDSWSPWLFIFDWGDNPPPDERLMKADEGYIDVDYFRSDRRYDRVQYRVRAYGNADGPPLRLVRAAVCVSDLTGIPTALPQPFTAIPPQDPASWQRRLPIPFTNQRPVPGTPDLRGGLCSPTSVQMVLGYRGVDVTKETVARRLRDPHHRIYGNWPRAVQGAYTFGVPGYLDRIAHWSNVEGMIADGQPLIISLVAEKGELRNAVYSSTDGHIIVLAGFDKQGRVAVNDPAARTPEDGRVSYYREDLEQVWMRRKGGTAYVLLPQP